MDPPLLQHKSAIQCATHHNKMKLKRKKEKLFQMATNQETEETDSSSEDNSITSEEEDDENCYTDCERCRKRKQKKLQRRTPI